VSKVLATQRAMELLDAGVYLAVPRQHREPLKPLVADGAFKRSLDTVDHLVVAQRVVAAKRPVADGALVRLLARVAAAVRRQAARRRESFLAHATLVRLLTGVRLHVDLEVLGAAERFAAHEALVRLYACVDATVSLEMREPRELLITDAACEQLLVAGVTAYVQLQCTASLVASSAVHTLELCLHHLRSVPQTLPCHRSILVGRC